MNKTLSLHAGKQHLITNKDGLVIESAKWDIYLHAYKLTNGTIFTASKHDLLSAVRSIIPSATQVLYAEIPANVFFSPSGEKVSLLFEKKEHSIAWQTAIHNGENPLYTI